MSIKRSQTVFHNLLVVTDVLPEGLWNLAAVVLQEAAVQGNFYSNAPAFYQVVGASKEKGHFEYTVYQPISTRVEVNEDTPVEFIQELVLEDVCTFRFIEADMSIKQATAKLYDYARKRGLSLKEPFYIMPHEFYEDVIVDLIAPVE